MGSKSGGSNLFPGPLKNADAASAVTTTSSGRSLSAAATQEYSCEFGSSKYYALCGLGGILSCGITHTAVTPLDLVKCRLQVNKEKYKNTITGFKIPYTMMKFACFERTVELLYANVVPKPRAECTKGEQLIVTFAAGYIAGVFCAIVS